MGRVWLFRDSLSWLNALCCCCVHFGAGLLQRLFSSILTCRSVPSTENHPHSTMLSPPCFTIGMLFTSWWAKLGICQTSHLKFSPKFSVLSVQRVFFLRSPLSACHMTFNQQWFLSTNYNIKAWLMDYCWLPFQQLLPSLQRISEALLEWPMSFLVILSQVEF